MRNLLFYPSVTGIVQHERLLTLTPISLHFQAKSIATAAPRASTATATTASARTASAPPADTATRSKPTTSTATPAATLLPKLERRSQYHPRSHDLGGDLMRCR